MRLSRDETDSCEHRESANCDLKVNTSIVAGAQDNTANLITKVLRSAVSSLDSIRRSVDGVLVEDCNERLWIGSCYVQTWNATSMTER